MGGATWGPFTDEKSLLGLKLRRGQLGVGKGAWFAVPLERRAVICEQRARIESFDTPCLCLPAAPAPAATGLRLTLWLSVLIRRDRRRDGVDPVKGPWWPLVLGEGIASRCNGLQERFLLARNLFPATSYLSGRSNFYIHV